MSMSWNRPTSPHRPSSSPKCRARLRMTPSTVIRWRTVMSFSVLARTRTRASARSTAPFLPLSGPATPARPLPCCLWARRGARNQVVRARTVNIMMLRHLCPERWGKADREARRAVCRLAEGGCKGAWRPWGGTPPGASHSAPGATISHNLADAASWVTSCRAKLATLEGARRCRGEETPGPHPPRTSRRYGSSARVEAADGGLCRPQGKDQRRVRARGRTPAAG